VLIYVVELSGLRTARSDLFSYLEGRCLIWSVQKINTLNI
jgi:hypothetical protein